MKDRRRRARRGVVQAGLLWLTVVCGMLAFTQTAAAGPLPSMFTDLGTSLGVPKAVSTTDEVLGDTSVWRGGQLITPGNVPGASSDLPTMTMTDMSPDGVVFG